MPARVGGVSPIKHVFYVIRENRTFDQVLGDVVGGDGDERLCVFGEAVTPNQHALVKQFVLLDNTYCESDGSADGHNWGMAAYATDYVIKGQPANRIYDFEGGNPLSPHDDRVLGGNDVTVETSEDAVVLEQVSEGVVVRQIVDGHHLDIGALGEQRAVEVAADAAESVDSDTNSHGSIRPSWLEMSAGDSSVPTRSGGTQAAPSPSTLPEPVVRMLGVVGRVRHRGHEQQRYLSGTRTGPIVGLPATAQSASTRSAGMPASVSGMPSSAARLSAIARSRLIRPAMASLVSSMAPMTDCSAALSWGGVRSGMPGSSRAGSSTTLMATPSDLLAVPCPTVPSAVHT